MSDAQYARGVDCARGLSFSGCPVSFLGRGIVRPQLSLRIASDFCTLYEFRDSLLWGFRFSARMLAYCLSLDGASSRRIFLE